MELIPVTVAENFVLSDKCVNCEPAEAADTKYVAVVMLGVPDEPGQAELFVIGQCELHMLYTREMVEHGLLLSETYHADKDYQDIGKRALELRVQQIKDSNPNVVAAGVITL